MIRCPFFQLVQDPKGKAKWRGNAESDGILALDVPLELLGKPICKRSSAHLESALHLIEVTPLGFRVQGLVSRFTHPADN